MAIYIFIRNFAISQIKNILNEIKNVVSSEQEAYEVVERVLRNNGLTAVASEDEAENIFKKYSFPMPYGVQRGEDYNTTLDGKEDGGWQPSFEIKVTELYTDAGMDSEDYIYLIHVEER